MKRREKISIILNCLIFIFTVFATITMVLGIKFMGQFEVLSARNFKSFKNMELGYLEECNTGYRLTSKGLDFANQVFMDFV